MLVCVPRSTVCFHTHDHNIICTNFRLTVVILHVGYVYTVGKFTRINPITANTARQEICILSVLLLGMGRMVSSIAS